MICHICDEPINPGDPRHDGTNFVAHRECMLRDAIGGIGHLIDHAHFCSVKGDPDAGLSRHLSALLVDTWVSHVGVEEAAKRSITPLD